MNPRWVGVLAAAAIGVSDAQTLQQSLALEREAALAEAREQLEALRAVQRRLPGNIERLEAEIAQVLAQAPPPGKRTHARGAGKIVNGVLTWSYPTAGALLHGADAGSAGSHCTGTLIGTRTFLTAAHCVEDDPTPGNYHVFLQHGGIFAVSALVRHPDYRFPHADLAVLRLASPVHGILPTALHTAPVPLGASGDIVGFGRAGGIAFDYGIKRAGEVQVTACDRPETSLLCWDFDEDIGVPGQDSNTCNADSGGPLYIQPGGQDTPLVLAGVTSGGSLDSCLGGDHSYDVDVRQFVDWITEVAEEPLGVAAPDDVLPRWGSEKVSSPSAQVRFDAASREQKFTLPVPTGTALLRVALNGHDEGTRNFDLSVASAQVHCTQDGNGQYAFCEFALPASGNWTITVRARQGNGIAQVTATVYEP